ncbi:hypothetical protein [Nostoc sp. UHCC 0870]|uniref:hypothetical protein n=1 Tax=Nostoc sp. UHCC 0870 TaxID=2914041 RepID=UPI0030D9C26A
MSEISNSELGTLRLSEIFHSEFSTQNLEFSTQHSALTTQNFFCNFLAIFY